mmetsp:Transcript_18398/g.29795  ORF Transcript_18398/g.29795 Transcript_18398/m.29795 type:complete len:89 (-) Transcript_18398:151-417(-)
MSCCLSAGIPPILKTKLSKMKPSSESEHIIVDVSPTNILKDHIHSDDPLHLGKQKQKLIHVKKEMVFSSDPDYSVWYHSVTIHRLQIW